ncbi:MULTISPECIES: dolichol kinase [Haloprofundus]|uniref:dolichol kinase n=1 Tax=Haloprofundus TaxID=1911573 RepID=UPI000E43942C|nr:MULTISPECIES: dolichol kinase [Haloprofundus]QCJ46865.1 dolichol kinase [Haloprofundus sp. MHR1]
MSELARRGVHASGTAVPGLYLVGALTWQELGYVLLGLSALVSVLELVRLGVGLDWWVYRNLTREYEQENVAGYALYMYSMTAVAWLFPWFVAVPGMLMLTVGDPISGILGSNEAGRAKELGVLGVMFLVCFALAVPFTTGPAGVSRAVGVAAAAAGAAGATFADGVKPVVAGYVVDDNLSIPPTACVGIAAVLVAV